MNKNTFILAALLMTAQSYAAALQVSPTTVNFKTNDKATPLWLSNTGTESLKGQVRIYQWEQHQNGESLTDTQELVASPPIVDIPPGGKQLVRLVRMNHNLINNEQSFRVIVDELPKPDSPQQAGINFLLRYSVPVFIEGQKSNLLSNVANVSFDVAQSGNHLLLTAKNSQTTHVKLSGLRYVGLDGKQTDLYPGLMGYVLPEGQNQWNIKQVKKGGYFEAVVNDGKTPEKLFTWSS